MSDDYVSLADEDDRPDDAEVPEEPEVLVIKVIRQTKPIRLEMEDGTTLVGTLREMMGARKDEWLNFLQLRTKMVDGQPVGMKDYKGLEAHLISFCLYDSNSKQVSEQIIDRWPVTVKDKLFKVCQKMNALDAKKEGEDDAKNF